MNENFELFNDGLNHIKDPISSMNQSLDFTIEIEGKIENHQLKCYVNNMNSSYINYLKVKRSDIIGKNIVHIYDGFANIYYEIGDYLFKNPIKESISIYVRKKNDKLEIVDFKEIMQEDCDFWEVMAYPFRRETELIKLFIVIKDMSKNFNNMKEKRTIQDIEIYNDKIMSMSDMISNLSHAWRQPLNSLNFSIINLIDEIENEPQDGGILDEYYQEIWQIIKNLSRKIEKFKSFFEMNYKKELFNITKYIDLVFEIMEEKIKKENIKMNILTKEDIKMYGSPNEFVQFMYYIFWDIIEYCKEVFDLYDRCLNIRIEENKDHIYLTIENEYDKEKYTDFKINLNHLSMLDNIIRKNMNGAIKLKNDENHNKIMIRFPLDIRGNDIWKD
ncbi:HAMP domain-containing histidine kinase [Anaerophilus nitritogenes]|uniref:HAMP domain-containing histidine kinase n=1 Tax=Anaerophilus nitritogenes TaxID=2498136 RepID=UPI00101C5518|nr:HAMP domain-containing histidine kinase [Anaerophilus nitritogenes]